MEFDLVFDANFTIEKRTSGGDCKCDYALCRRLPGETTAFHESYSRFAGGAIIMRILGVR